MIQIFEIFSIKTSQNFSNSNFPRSIPILISLKPLSPIKIYCLSYTVSFSRNVVAQQGPNPSRGTNCRRFRFLVAHRFRGKSNQRRFEIQPRLFFTKKGEGDRCNAFFLPPPPKNKKRGGQIFAVTPTPLVPSCIALVRRHVIIPG